MKYVISRTSMWDEKPCEESKREPVLKKHIRTVTELEFNKKFSNREGLWKSKGINHKTINGGKWICRDEDYEDWVIEVDDLLDFSKKYGEIILAAPCEKSEYYLPTIEIYDGYRE